MYLHHTANRAAPTTLTNSTESNGKTPAECIDESCSLLWPTVVKFQSKVERSETNTTTRGRPKISTTIRACYALDMLQNGSQI